MADVVRIRSAIENALQTQTKLSGAVARDVAFHMTDWLEDLERFHQFCQVPDSRPPEQVLELLHAFLLHVPNHVAAASKQLTGIPVTDIFDVGATTEGETA